jgi:ribosomal protein S18 acetylase RimI-like enzyme
MSSIRITDHKEIDSSHLQKLFMDVGWSSAQYPVKLEQAMAHSFCVYTAWENEELIGLVNCISDGSMYAYIPYLLVHPSRQFQGVGSLLLQQLLQHLKNLDIYRIVLLSEKETQSFYEKLGFSPYIDAYPMYQMFTFPKT